MSASDFINFEDTLIRDTALLLLPNDDILYQPIQEEYERLNALLACKFRWNLKGSQHTTRINKQAKLRKSLETQALGVPTPPSG